MQMVTPIPEREQERLRELDQELAAVHAQAKDAAFQSMILRRKAAMLEESAIKAQVAAEGALREYARKIKKRLGVPDGATLDLVSMTIKRPVPQAVPSPTAASGVVPDAASEVVADATDQ